MNIFGLALDKSLHASGTYTKEMYENESTINMHVCITRHTGTNTTLKDVCYVAGNGGLKAQPPWQLSRLLSHKSLTYIPNLTGSKI